MKKKTKSRQAKMERKTLKGRPVRSRVQPVLRSSIRSVGESLSKGSTKCEVERRAAPGVARRSSKGVDGRRRDTGSQFVMRAATGLVLILFFCAVLFLLPPFALSVFFGVALLAVLFFEWPRLFPCAPKVPCIGSISIIGALLFFVYPVIPFILAVKLNQSLEYRKLLFYLAMSVALFDFGSYLFGSWLGKHKIAPEISPRKSWEGAIGGYLLVTALLFFLFSRAGTASWVGTFLISTVICCLALAGDLFESVLKRRVGIKDTGSFLPGHGGFLDRFDAMLFVVPFFYYFKEFLAYMFGIV